MSNVEIVTNIDIASEIAHATVTEVLANMENERVSYVLMGVLQQIEKFSTMSMELGFFTHHTAVWDMRKLNKKFLTVVK